MAKTKVNIEEEGMLKEAPIVGNYEETATENKERIAEEVTVTVETKKVKVQVIEDVSCIVACTPYTLRKDKAYSVPSDVAAILCNANKAYRI